MTALGMPLPLRQTTAWGGYREARPIPHRYGACSGELLQYNDSRTEFCWADHPVQGIDAVIVNGQPAGEWERRTVTDVTGRPLSLVVFGQPPDEGVSILARGRGKLHPVTGALMTNPADVIWDVLANIAGRGTPPSELSEFRVACARANLEVGGSIEVADSVQSVVRGICTSIGATFCSDQEGLCRLWPGGVDAAPRATIRDGTAGATVTLDDLANDITVQFGYEDASPRGSVQLEAPDYIALHGRRPSVVEAPWVTSARVAFDVGQRILRQRARPQWRITLQTKRAVRVGHVVQVDHPVVPIVGAYPIMSRSYEPVTGTATLGVTAPAGEIPVVRLVRQSSAYDPLQYTGAGVATSGTDRVITLTNADGTPVADARVSVRELGLVAQSDAAGRVVFPAIQMPAGSFTLDVTTLAGDVLEVPILIV